MSCNTCNTTHPSDECPKLNFVLDGVYLVPRIGATPLLPVDLSPMVKTSETDTNLKLDVANRLLSYTGERAANNISSPDDILISSIAGLIPLNELQDVSYPAPFDGGILSYIDGNWTAYTPPTGTIVSELGVDIDGRIVKQTPGVSPSDPPAIPIGGTILWSGATGTIPSGFVPEDGRALNRVVYSDLYDIIGTTWGVGDGSTTFNIPDSRQRTSVGVGGSNEFASLGQLSGSRTVSLSAAQNGTHTHGMGNLELRANVGPTDSNAVNLDDWAGSSGPIKATNVKVGNAWAGSLANSGSGSPHNNIQPSMARYYIMRVI